MAVFFSFFLEFTGKVDPECMVLINQIARQTPDPLGDALHAQVLLSLSSRPMAKLLRQETLPYGT
jgi:hypothetical protein